MLDRRYLISVEAFSHAMGWRRLLYAKYRGRSMPGMKDWIAAMDPKVVRL